MRFRAVPLVFVVAAISFGLFPWSDLARVESAQVAAPMGTLACRGPANFSANASFTWTQDGNPVGPPANFSCTDSGQDGPKPLPPKPQGANDWKVVIRMKLGLAGQGSVQQESSCDGDQDWTPPDPAPKRWRMDCFNPAGGKVIWKVTQG